MDLSDLMLQEYSLKKIKIIKFIREIYYVETKKMLKQRKIIEFELYVKFNRFEFTELFDF